MLIAMPNKREKAELIVQKLTEIGIDEILFRPAENSVITQRNEKKAERLMKIAKEATEQSRGIRIPKVARCEDVSALCKDKQVIVFDKQGNILNPLIRGSSDSEGGLVQGGYVCGII